MTWHRADQTKPEPGINVLGRNRDWFFSPYEVCVYDGTYWRMTDRRAIEPDEEPTHWASIDEP